MQEQENDQHGERRPFQNHFLDVVDLPFYRVGFGVEDRQFDVGRQTPGQFGDRLLDAVADRNDVGVLYLGDIDVDGAVAIDAGNRQFFALAIDDVGDLVEQHRTVRTARHDDFAERARVLDLAFDAHQLLVRTEADITGRHILIRVLNRAQHFVDADILRRHLSRFQVDQNLPAGVAADFHLADAGHILQALDDHLFAQVG